MNILYFIPPLLLLTYLSYRKTEYGLYIILATVPGFLLRTQIWFVPTTWLELAIYTLATVSIIKHIKTGTMEAHLYYVLHQTKPYVIPVTVLILSVLVSILVSNNQARALGILKAWFLAPLIFGVIFLNKIKTRQAVPKTIFYFSLSAWPVIIYGIIEYILDINMTIPGRLDSFFSSPNYVAMYLVPITVLILGWVMVTKEKIYYFPWLASSLLTIFLTKSFGGWFSLLGAIIFLLIFIPRVTIKKTLSLIVLLIIITSLTFYAHQRSFSHYDNFWQVNSLQTRYKIWANSLKILARNPILGVGLADFKQEYQNYIDILPHEERPVEQQVLRPHNLYLDFWLETGIMGLVAFLWLILIFYQQNLSDYLKKQNLLILPASAAMMAILLHGLVDTPYFKNDLSLLFWFLIVINTALISRSSQK